MHIECFTSDTQGAAFARSAWPLLALDFPLSLLGDTLTLPYTVPVSVWRTISDGELHWRMQAPDAEDLDQPGPENR
jgi:hypothetical protein